MSRLEQKCVIASAGFHLLLLVLIVVGPAFMFSRSTTVDNLPVLQMIPDLLTDKPFSGGGTPDIKPPPPSVAPPAAARTEPKPPEARQEPRKADPPPPRPVERVRPRSEVPDIVPPAKRLPDVSTELVTRKTDSKAAEKARLQAEEQAAARRQELADARRRSQEVRDAIRSLKEGATGPTRIETPGPGGGGPAYANYAQVVKSIYYNAWLVPASIVDENATTLASITIARDGTVIAREITRPSGNAAADASVQRTLNRVIFIAPFPAGATEERRTYPLQFDLKTKRLLE